MLQRRLNRRVPRDRAVTHCRAQRDRLTKKIIALLRDREDVMDKLRVLLRNDLRIIEQSDDLIDLKLRLRQVLQLLNSQQTLIQRICSLSDWLSLM